MKAEYAYPVDPVDPSILNAQYADPMSLSGVPQYSRNIPAYAPEYTATKLPASAPPIQRRNIADSNVLPGTRPGTETASAADAPLCNVCQIRKADSVLHHETDNTSHQVCCQQCATTLYHERAHCPWCGKMVTQFTVLKLI
jgi:hypothetical protein